MDSPQPASSTASSSSIDTDEELEQRKEMFVGLVREAATLIYGDTGSSSTTRTGNIERNRAAANDRLMQDYFCENPTYTREMFRRRFRMSRELFERIVQDLADEYPFFRPRNESRVKPGFTSIQKCTSAIRQLAYGVAADSLDEYLRMGDKTSRDCLQHFCTGIMNLYGKEYLRKPTFVDVQKLYAAHETRHGFPGMLGSLDCTHWEWAACPVAWRGQYMRGDHPHPTIMLEAVTSQDTWFWHAFFGVPGSNNDLNVLYQSPIFNDVYDGKAPECPFEVNGVTYKHGYLLVDGIYPEWATFVKSFACPHDVKRKKFSKAQEAARKDVERAFGILKGTWQILHHPARGWQPERLGHIMYACIILHNMILQDEGRAICCLNENDIVSANVLEVSEEQRAANVVEVRDKDTHINLRADLVEHISRLDLPHLDNV